MLPPDESLYTPEEVAQQLRVSRKWVYDHASGRRQPKLPSYEITESRRKTRRFSRKQIAEFLAKCERLMNR